MKQLNNNIITIEELLNKDFEYKLEKKKEGENEILYYDLVASFDIETTSFINENGKQATMYIWMLCLEGNVVIGRKWSEFMYLMNELNNKFCLDINKRLIIWVHNLSFEFQFICKKFNWYNVFARSKREPMKAVTYDGFEFRCSYILAGCGLEKVGQDLTTYKVKKLTGNLDYELIRGCNTKLTNEELQYCINDVLVVCAYVWEQIEYYKSITKIPLTNTGRVRKLIKKECFNKKYYKHYRALMNELIITSNNEYKMMKQAFQGGYTHASWLKSEFKINNVKSYDFTSSYPTVMISERYPMGRGKLVTTTLEEIEKGRHCYIFNIRFNNIKSKIDYEHYISKSKCWESEKIKEDNGRVIEAKSITMTITDVDYNIIKDFYTWESVELGKIYQYKKGFLPRPFVECIIQLYEEKTQLKDVVGKELDYNIKKGMLNSCYGMTCMDVYMDEVLFENGEWLVNKRDLTECIKEYNEDKGRFLFYAWGVFVTAYARRNLFYGIKNVGEDYIYSDTDSIKITNYNKHIDFINKYNEWIVKKLDLACEFHGIDKERTRPKNQKGKTKQLGIWDDDGYYESFKTLGAKRYIVKYDGKIRATIAGVNKRKAGEYLNIQEDGFNTFNDGLNIPVEYSGKLTACYIDNKIKGVLIDYKGNEMEYEEDSCVNLSVTDYKMGVSELYRKLLDSRVINRIGG